MIKKKKVWIKHTHRKFPPEQQKKKKKKIWKRRKMDDRIWCHKKIENPDTKLNIICQKMKENGVGKKMKQNKNKKNPKN